MMQFFDKFHKVLYRKREESPYARLTDRMIAASMDMLLLYLIILPLSSYIYTVIYPEGSAINEAIALTAQEYPELAKTANSSALFMAAQQAHPDMVALGIRQFLFNSGLQFFLMGVFIIPFIKIWGATPGKIFVGIKVVDSITGGSINWWQSVIRYIGYIPSCVFLFIGLFWVGFNERKRAWHDYLADTVVIYDPNRWYKKLFSKINLWLFGNKK